VENNFIVNSMTVLSFSQQFTRYLRPAFRWIYIFISQSDNYVYWERWFLPKLCYISS